jgi:hypothetical protein
LELNLVTGQVAAKSLLQLQFPEQNHRFLQMNVQAEAANSSPELLHVGDQMSSQSEKKFTVPGGGKAKGHHGKGHGESLERWASSRVGHRQCKSPPLLILPSLLSLPAAGRCLLTATRTQLEIKLHTKRGSPHHTCFKNQNYQL